MKAIENPVTARLKFFGMPNFLSDLDDSGHESGAEVAAQPVARQTAGSHESGAEVATPSTQPVARQTAFVGRGRWGDKLDRALGASRAREGKASRAALRHKEQKIVAKDALREALIARERDLKRGGNQYSRKIGFEKMMKIAYQVQQQLNFKNKEHNRI